MNLLTIFEDVEATGIVSEPNDYVDTAATKYEKSYKISRDDALTCMYASALKLLGPVDEYELIRKRLSQISLKAQKNYW